MAKVITAGMTTHLGLEATSVATLWRVTRTDEQEFFFTDHDVDIEFEGIVYESAVGYNPTAVTNKVGLSVDELEVSGFLDSSSLTEADLRAGRFDFAEVKVSLVNWQNLADGQLQIRRGRMGEVTFSDSGLFQAELRGMAQAYSQQVVELFQSECRADLGDSRCKINLAPDVVLANTVYALADEVRTSPSLDGLVSGALLVPGDTDADDKSPNAATATLGSQAVVQTVEKKFGAGAIEFSPTGSVDPSNAFVSFPDIGAYTLGANEFTIECWVRFKDLTDLVQTFMSHYINTGNQRSWRLYRDSGDLAFFVSDDGTNVSPALTITGAFTWAVDTWYHIAVTRDSNDDVRMFVDGVQVGSTTAVAFSIHNSTGLLYLGKIRSAGFDDFPLDGFVDDPRIVVGDALYTGGFTPPVAAHAIVSTVINGLTTPDYEDVVYDVTVAGTTGGTYPDFDPVSGNTTVWGTVTFTAREAFTRAGVVDVVTDNRTFTMTFPNGVDSRAVDDWFKFGGLTWESGQNVGLSMEVKAWVQGTSAMQLFLKMPFPIVSSDTFRVFAGCDKQLSTCIAKFGNVVNYRGEPYVPGQGDLLNTPNAR